MTTAMYSQLIAIEDSSLETVAGGFSMPEYKKPSFDLNVQLAKNEVDIKDNVVLSGGDTLFAITQTITQSNK